MDKEIKKLTGQLAYPTLGLAVGVWLSYTSVLLAFAAGYLPTFVAMLFVTLLTFVSYTVMHEAVHGNISGSRGANWLDKIIGYSMSPIMTITFTSHQKEHFAHHKNTNNRKKDPDAHIEHAFDSLKNFLRSINKTTKFHNGYVWNTATKIEIAVYLGWRFLFIYFVGWTAILVVFLGTWLGLLLTGIILSYLPHQPYNSTERWKNTNIRLFSAPWIEKLMFQHNLHAVHHLYPRIPFYNYRKAFEKLEPSMRENGTPFIEQ